MNSSCQHTVRRATPKESKADCCGDRYESNVAYVCACGEKGCESCMSCHLFEIHGENHELHLYCTLKNPDHSFDEFPHVYTHEYGSRCRAVARKSGWRINPNGTAVCPKCMKRKGR